MSYGIEVMKFVNDLWVLELLKSNKPKKKLKNFTLTLSLWPYPRIDGNPRLGPSQPVMNHAIIPDAFL